MDVFDLRQTPPAERASQMATLLAELPLNASASFIADTDPREYDGSARFDWEVRPETSGVWHAQASHRGAAMAERTVSELVEGQPQLLPVFQHFGIDLCCGGGLTLAQAAAAHTIPLPTLINALVEA